MKGSLVETAMAASHDRLYFFSGSKDVYPGKGVHEHVDDPGAYTELSKIKHWRRVLSNFHESPFEYMGYQWNTIEHAFQGVKLGLEDMDKMFQMTLNSKSDVGSGSGKDARAKRKWVVLSQTNLQRWDKMKDSVMEEIARAKFGSDIEAMTVLRLTQKAQLWHVVPRGKPVQFTHLERIRYNL